MSCSKHIFGIEWEHHTWRREVTATDEVPTHHTNMWGREVNGTACRCFTREVCERCGTVRHAQASCICDNEVGEVCPPRVECLRRQALH
jgi:hypothetical protein